VEMVCVLREVGTEYLYIIQINIKDPRCDTHHSPRSLLAG
jgi:hypothetical protein